MDRDDPGGEPAFLTATRASYDAVAADYTERFGAELAGKPLDRALLTAFAELVRAGGGGPVADIGCAFGHVTAHLDGLGVGAFGIDVSPEMVALARRRYPDLRFDEGSMTALDLPDGALGGVLTMYSIIHVPPALLPSVFIEFHRVLAPGGQLMLVFQAGDEQGRVTEAFGHAISLDYHRLPPDRVADQLADAGFVVHSRLLREPDRPLEKTQQAYLFARKLPVVDRS